MPNGPRELTWVAEYRVQSTETSALGTAVKRLFFTLRADDRAMQRISREDAKKYAFDWRDEPLLRVARGESFELETYDASGANASETIPQSASQFLVLFVR